MHRSKALLKKQGEEIPTRRKRQLHLEVRLDGPRQLHRSPQTVSILQSTMQPRGNSLQGRSRACVLNLFKLEGLRGDAYLVAPIWVGPS